MFLFQPPPLISPETARMHLQSGAELESQRIPGVINIPLGELADGASRYLPDKNQVLLLHCRSGTRSGIACGLLERMGYSRVFNLGSFGRAQSIRQSL